MGMLSTCYPTICLGSSFGSWDRDLAGGWLLPNDLLSLLLSPEETLGKEVAPGGLWDTLSQRPCTQRPCCYTSLHAKDLIALELSCIPHCLSPQALIAERGEPWSSCASTPTTLRRVPVAAAVPPGRVRHCTGVQAAAAAVTGSSTLLAGCFC